MGYLIVIGIAIGLAGSFSSAFGYYIIRTLHNHIIEDLVKKGTPRDDPDLQSKSKSLEYKYCRFYVAFVLLIFGAVASTTNLGLLGQMAIAPFAAFALLFNALLGRLVMVPPEPYTWIHASSAMIIVAGLVVSCTQVDVDNVRTYTPDEIWDLFCRDWVVGLTASTALLIFLSAIWVQHNSAEGLEFDTDSSERKKVETNVARASGVLSPEEGESTPFLAEGDARSSVDPKPSSSQEFDFSRTCFGLMYYGLMCGICSGLNSAILKAIVEFIKDGDDNHTEHLKNYPFWVLLALLIPFIVLQAWFLNQGLRRHQSVQFIPPMTAFIIVCNAGAGHVYYDEGSEFSDRQMVLFLVGIAISILGAIVVMFSMETKKVGPECPSPSATSDDDGNRVKAE